MKEESNLTYQCSWKKNKRQSNKWTTIR